MYLYELYIDGNSTCTSTTLRHNGGCRAMQKHRICRHVTSTRISDALASPYDPTIRSVRLIMYSDTLVVKAPWALLLDSHSPEYSSIWGQDRCLLRRCLRLRLLHCLCLGLSLEQAAPEGEIGNISRSLSKISDPSQIAVVLFTKYR